MNLEVGDIVLSVAGRDIGEMYVLWGFSGKEFLLVNGKFRKINSPKKKNPKHIVFKNKSALYKECAEKGENFNDALIRKILKFEENC